MKAMDGNICDESDPGSTLTFDRKRGSALDVRAGSGASAKSGVSVNSGSLKAASPSTYSRGSLAATTTSAAAISANDINRMTSCDSAAGRFQAR